MSRDPPRAAGGGPVEGEPTAELTCRELVELVTEYLEGSLSREERGRFERHLAGCPGCEAHLRQLRETVRAAGRISERSLSAEARRRLLLAFRGFVRARSSGAS